MLEWQTGTVVNIIQTNATTKQFFIKADNTPNFQFEAGQFVTLDLPIHEQKNKRWRSYSIASTPNDSNVFELVIVLLPDGLGTPYLFEHVTVGSQLTFRGPQGKFTLPKPIETDLYFVCTGTGVAPFRSMIHYIYNNNIPHKNIYLFFGCRYVDDCLYKDEFLELQKLHSDFKYTPCLSRDEKEYELMHKGYVHTQYINCLTARLSQNHTPAKFYLCGWKNMIDEAKQNILQLGYDKHDIHLELYG